MKCYVIAIIPVLDAGEREPPSQYSGDVRLAK
jgi:hypothetical protein